MRIRESWKFGDLILYDSARVKEVVQPHFALVSILIQSWCNSGSLDYIDDFTLFLDRRSNETHSLPPIMFSHAFLSSNSIESPKGAMIHHDYWQQLSAPSCLANQSASNWSILGICNLELKKLTNVGCGPCR